MTPEEYQLACLGLELATFQACRELRLSVVVKADAPGTWSELQRSGETRGFRSRTVAPTEHPALTVYQTGAVGNSLARAWHDYVHLSLGTDFSEAGERAACEAQVAWLRSKGYGPTVIAVLRAEVVGQVSGVLGTGEFATDQRSYNYSWISLNPSIAYA